MEYSPLELTPQARPLINYESPIQITIERACSPRAASSTVSLLTFGASLGYDIRTIWPDLERVLFLLYLSFVTNDLTANS